MDPMVDFIQELMYKLALVEIPAINLLFYDNYVNNYSYPKVIGGIFELLLPKNKSRNEFTQITIIGKTI